MTDSYATNQFPVITGFKMAKFWTEVMLKPQFIIAKFTSFKIIRGYKI